MATKYQLITGLYESTAETVTNTPLRMDGVSALGLPEL